MGNMDNNNKISENVTKANNINVFVKQRLSAAEANALMKAPTKLLNTIYRNIKDAAEYGEPYVLYTAPMCEETQEYILRALSADGYNYAIGVVEDAVILVPETDTAGEISVPRRMVNLFIYF